MIGVISLLCFLFSAAEIPNQYVDILDLTIGDKVISSIKKNWGGGGSGNWPITSVTLKLDDENLESRIEMVEKVNNLYNYMEDRLELRIIAEKKQSVENGIRFSVELENKGADTLLFRVRIRERFKTMNRRSYSENGLPFRFNIYTQDKSFDLAEWDNIDDNSMSIDRFIKIDGNSTIELDSVVFLDYRAPGELQFVEKNIVPGTYIIEACFNGFLVDDYNKEEFISVIVTPFEVVLE